MNKRPRSESFPAEARRGLLTLPQETLLHILQYAMANQAAVSLVAQVSKELGAVAWSREAVRCVRVYFRGVPPWVVDANCVGLVESSKHWTHLTIVSPQVAWTETMVRLSTLESLVHLDIVSARYNVTSEEGMVISSLAGVATLILQGSRACGRVQTVAGIAMMPSLTALHLPHCHLTDEALAALAPLSASLTLLNISGNEELTGLGVGTILSPFKKLSVLNLFLCRGMTDDGVIALATDLPVLSSLDLCDCYQVTDRALTMLGQVPSLTVLDLSQNTKITDMGVFALARLPALASLNLDGCWRLTDAVARALGAMTTLTSLELPKRGPRSTYMPRYY